MKNVLLIVDPQNDFITGTLPVQGAKEKMQKLAAYIKEKGAMYDHICVTLDSHTKDHSSFKDNGGIWPEHCVMHTTGWDPPHYLDEVLRTFDVTYYNKGNIVEKEEYSIFDNEEDGYVLARQLRELMKEDEELFVDVCGIAGDFCVLETLKGLCQIMGNDHISVLTEFTASIDGGEKLQNFIDENNLGFIIDSSLNLDTYAIH